VGEVLQVLRAANPNASSPFVVSGRNIVSADLGRQRLGAWFFSGFGLVALFVGAGSVFGLVSYLAESRRREFGIRLALGASHWDVARLGISVALIPSMAGLLLGLGLSVGLSRVFTALLVGVSPFDWLTFSAVSVGLLSASAIAALAAAVRLRGILPIDALKTT
jgi:ABC-type antimicrobial peptide transport system permease subunit